MPRAAAPAPRRPATTRFQWVCVTLMFWGFLLFLAWFFQALFDYKVRLRAAIGVYPICASSPLGVDRIPSSFTSQSNQSRAPAADTAVVPFGTVMAPAWGVMASAINAFAGVGRPLAEYQVRLVGLMNLVFPNAGPLVTFGAQALYMLLYGRA